MSAPNNRLLNRAFALFAVDEKKRLLQESPQRAGDEEGLKMMVERGFMDLFLNESAELAPYFNKAKAMMDAEKEKRNEEKNDTA